MKQTPKFKCPLCPDSKWFSTEKGFSMHRHDKGHPVDTQPLEVTAADRSEANENETIEMRRAHHAAQQAKRADSRARNTELLRQAGIPFVVKNNGAHIIIADAVDFWPGPGKWHSRTLPTKGYGVRELLKFLGHKTAVLSEVAHG